ncbi:MAG: phosphatidylserine decarboxylase [Gammaproteobacteria bacterium]|nr:phosphatidylserine decarboxylase [Gammaproteobacteria bacterium]|tara:strand:- start:4384 stop:5226 length:843 start_codon:yes stop_codon:yes gene_type:complete
MMLKGILHLFLTKIIGRLANSKIWIIKSFLIKAFIYLYKPNLEESLFSDNVSFPTYNSFFTRTLKKEVRPIEKSISSIISPVDGEIIDFGHLTEGNLIQAKKYNYPLHELIGDYSKKLNYSNSYFITIYLAPTDYHRIHCPYEGKIISTQHLGKNLFSVNQRSQEKIPNLYIKNERAVMKIENNYLSYFLISVGASIVGSVVPFWFQEAHNSRKKLIHEWNKGPKDNQKAILKGQEIAHFKMGSTVILLFEDASRLDLNSLTDNKSVKFGSKLIELRNLN